MEKQIIQEKVLKARMQRLLNNCYSMDSADRCTRLWTGEDGFIWSWEDHGVQRLTFFANDRQALDRLLGQVDGGRYYLELMTKDPAEYKPAGAKQVAALMRLANPDCRSVFEKDSPVLGYFDPAVGEPAADRDIPEINRLLWDTFHTEISHLLTDEELLEKAGQLTIHREGRTIDALLQAEVLPKKFYLNQIVNRGNRKNIHAMLLNRLKAYTEAGGKYLYAWVEDRNIASQKFHQKYGMKHDGMWNVLYAVER